MQHDQEAWQQDSQSDLKKKNSYVHYQKELHALYVWVNGPGVLSHKEERRNRVDLHAFLFVSTPKIERKKKKSGRLIVMG